MVLEVCALWPAVPILYREDRHSVFHPLARNIGSRWKLAWWYTQATRNILLVSANRLCDDFLWIPRTSSIKPMLTVHSGTDPHCHLICLEVESKTRILNAEPGPAMEHGTLFISFCMGQSRGEPSGPPKSLPLCALNTFLLALLCSFSLLFLKYRK